MIIDEKLLRALASPPPYRQASGGAVNSSQRPSSVLPTLPANILLQITYSVFPIGILVDDCDLSMQGDVFAIQREALHFLADSLRLVNRSFYAVCMHILRSIYFPAYCRFIRPPYTSDPIPSLMGNASSSEVNAHRELAVLDRFIVLVSHEDQRLQASDLQLPREEAYRDLFDIMQPKNRMEDLVLTIGRQLGAVCDVDDVPPYSRDAQSTLDTPSSCASSIYSMDKKETDEELPEKLSDWEMTSICPSLPSNPWPKHTSTRQKSRGLLSFLRPKKKKPAPPPQVIASRPRVIEPLPFEALSVTFSPRKVGLVYSPPRSRPCRSATFPLPPSSPAFTPYVSSSLGASTSPRKRTIVEVVRHRDESLESCALRLVQALLVWLKEE
ncbi:hypothetical protein CYLTODRAFT_492501 [Cylindrobasidium torrendii FP15055 ss-10]|uniref:Uncharacterized protein n=1 Tax=Cylindrobasidium torrendii FP15055 ss-10 TaxID=1314674 RepID=A0A0D7B6Q2_9AGAR|nr:hypothetical protein CYLTODRAFT_492501 [Cylindrobasidium torrendii FP15055 ss-10]